MLKLYRLTNKLGKFYVVAKSSDIAIDTLVNSMSKSDYGFYKDREVTNIEILANEVTCFPDNIPNFSGGSSLLVQTIQEDRKG